MEDAFTELSQVLSLLLFNWINSDATLIEVSHIESIYSI